MKKKLALIFITFISALVVTLHAQENNNRDYYKGLETARELKLTNKQVAEIKKMKREASSKFAAIGKDRTLTGYEKGQKKRDLAIQLRENIKSVLTTEQIKLWEDKYGKIKDGNGIKNTATDSIDDQLDRLEAKYEDDIKLIENNFSLSKEEKKTQKKILKENYKKNKLLLKEKKKDIKEIF